MNTSSFQNVGIYFLKISDENKKSIRKFIVK
ncbi:MAG: T9SS type A sorting domain-containing protein [Flavobacterium sp.]|nr:T9SS type A sorting domain-containing protein [Flavobacterium sp.]